MITSTSVTRSAALGLLLCSSPLALGCESEHEPPAAAPVVAEPLAAAAPVAKAEPKAEAEQPAETLPVLEVHELERLLAEEQPVTVLDANGDQTRAEFGVVPGAKLLPGKEYDLAILPKDKGDKLVFYCGGVRCRSADKAAKRAVAAGYGDVNVLRAGIRGWVEAGKPVDKPQVAGG